MTQLDRLPTRTNLTLQVYGLLREALLDGRLRPRQRLRIRDLAALLAVSETPVREAVMQLVRERGLLLQTARSLTVPLLSVPVYLELRRIRLELEGLAASEAAARIGKREIAALVRLHAKLLRAERAGAGQEAVVINWQFHATVYRAAAMPELLNLIEGLWLRTGPLLSLMYPLAPPTYPGRHRHEDIVAALEARDGQAVRDAIAADTLEGGAGLLRLLEDLHAGRVDETEVIGPDPGLGVLGARR